MKLTPAPLLAAILVMLAPHSHADYILRAPLGLSGPDLSEAGLTLSSASVDFGSIAVGQKASSDVVLTNPGGASKAVEVASPEAPFSMAHDCPAGLAPGASCTLTFGFAPTSAGAATGAATAGGQAVRLSGIGEVLTAERVVAGPASILALRPDGTLWVTGSNGNGQLGLHDYTDRVSFEPVRDLSTQVAGVASAVSHTLVLKTDGTLWATGGGGYGQLGFGNTTSRKYFGQVPNMGG